MNRVKQLQGPFLAGVIWLALALTGLWLRERGGAALLVWLPGAVAVAALHGHEPRRWPAYLGAITLAQICLFAVDDVPLTTGLAVIVASITQAILTTVIGIRVLGGVAGVPCTLRQFVGLFAAALIGSAAHALIYYPFSPRTGAEELAWWFMASGLGVFVGVPILLYLRQGLGFGAPHVQLSEDNELRGLPAATLGMFVVAVLALNLSSFPLLWLLLVVHIFAVIRHGQLGASMAAMCMAVAAALISLGGDSPAAFLPLPQATAVLMLQASMLAMLATSLPIAVLLRTHHLLEAEMRGNNAALHKSLTTLHLAESLVGIGCWHYDIRSGKQTWPDQMLEIDGQAREPGRDPADIRHLIPDAGEALFKMIARQRDAREPYTCEYGIRRPDGTERILRTVLNNEFDEHGERIAVLAVSLDVTEQLRREGALKKARRRAVVIAAEAQHLAMTDPLTDLANRRCTLENLERMLKSCARSGEPLAIVMFDIDHFKSVNDGYGHQTGDAVLVRIAEVTRKQARGEGLIGRIGGEEFVWLLPGVVPAKAGELAERLRLGIQQGSAGGGLPPVTVSLGLAQWQPGDATERLLARADAALYGAKEEGRNRVNRAA